MESSKRNTWLIVIFVLVALCCLAAIVAAALVGWLVYRADDVEWGTSWERGWEIGRASERTEQTFDLGPAPYLQLDSFAGNVTVRAGEGNTIRVVATKRAGRESDLERIQLTWDEQPGGLQIKAELDRFGLNNISVDLEITVPSGASLDLDTGAGNVDVQGVPGDTRAHTGAGNISVGGASGPVDLDTGAGNIDYEGRPQGACTFETGAGNITLSLPSDASVEVELDTGIGNVSVTGFDLQGRVSRSSAEGTIGDGMDGSITASTGAGNISLIRR